MPDFESLDADVQRQVDRICDEFDRQLQQQNPPSIQELLGDLDESAKRVLFHELIRLDLDNRDSIYSRVDQLREEFPQYGSEIDSELQSRRPKTAPSAAEETVGHSTGSDTNPVRPKSREDNVPTRIEHYVLKEVLGSGAFGTVWKAEDTNLDRTVAIKLPRASNESANQFLKEAQIAARLTHPNIVGVYDTGAVDGQPFIVSEFIDGQPLNEWTTQNKVSPAEITRLGKLLGDSLHYAHEVGIVHRDLKPSNILVDHSGQPHVTDFGLAKRLADETMTVAGNLLGSPAYMSPEQAKGDAYRADRRSDVYSLGVILYELLVGERPFRGSPDSVIHQVIYNEPVAPSTVDPNVPKDLETICLKSMSKGPSQRYQSARLLADDLRRFENGEPIFARPVSTTERVWSWCKRNPAFASALALALGLLTFLAIAGPYVANQNAKEIRAQQERLYVTDMSVAQNALETGNSPRTIEVLKKYATQPDLQDLRCFDWHHLWCRANNPGVLSRQIPPNSGSFAMSPDRQLVAFSNGVGFVEIIRTGDLTTVKRLTGIEGKLSFHPAKPWILCEKDGIVVLWDFDKDALVQEYPDVHIQGMKFSRSGRYLGWSSRYTGPEIKVWDTETKKSFSFVEEDVEFQRLTFSPNRNRLFVTGSFVDKKGEDQTVETGMLAVIDLAEDGNHQKRIIPVDTRWTSEITFSDGGDVISLVDHRTIKLLDPETLEVKAETEWSAVNNAEFSPDGKYLACSSYVAGLNLYRCGVEYRSLELVAEFKNVPHRPWAGFTAVGRLLTAERDKLVLRDIADWHLADESRSAFTLARHYGALRVEIAPDNETVVSSGETGAVFIANLLSGKRLHTLQTTRRIMRTGIRTFPDISMSSDGKQLAIVNGLDVDIYDVTTGAKQNAIRVGESPLLAVALSPDSEYLATWDETGVLSHISLETKERLTAQLELKPKRNFAQSIEFSPDGRFIAVAGVRVALVLSSKDLSQHLKLDHPKNVFCLTFAPESNYLLTGSDYVIRMWDMETGGKYEFPSTDSFVTSLAWSPNGKTIASASEGQIKLWNVRTLEETITLTDFLPMPLDLEFSPDGESLIAAAFSGDVKVWRAPKAQTKKTVPAR